MGRISVPSGCSFFSSFYYKTSSQLQCSSSGRKKYVEKLWLDNDSNTSKTDVLCTMNTIYRYRQYVYTYV